MGQTRFLATVAFIGEGIGGREGDWKALREDCCFRRVKTHEGLSEVWHTQSPAGALLSAVSVCSVACTRAGLPSLRGGAAPGGALLQELWFGAAAEQWACSHCSDEWLSPCLSQLQRVGAGECPFLLQLPFPFGYTDSTRRPAVSAVRRGGAARGTLLPRLQPSAAARAFPSAVAWQPAVDAAGALWHR
jgi:hypothetical protein